MSVLLVVLAVILGGAGAAKVAGARFTRENFARWPIDERLRVRIGVVELVLAALLVVGLGSDLVAAVAALGVLVAMAIALRVHLAAKDPVALTAGAPITGLLAVVVLVLAIA